MSLSVEALQLVRLAPKRLKRVVVALVVRVFVVSPVVEALPRDEVRDVRTLEVREDADVVAR
jgi:hypothetical protein